jgi:hypothetical protein
MIKPNFIIAGVARCGTTSLYHYLKQHPEIGFPKVKEPKYFSSKHLKFPHTGPGDETVDVKVVKDENEYFNLFNGLKDKKAIGEASSDYFYFYHNTISEIKKVLGDVKIILCFRNPIERTYSAYSNLIRDSRETLTFEKAIEKEEDRIKQNFDWMWAYKNGSLYAEGLKKFQTNFSNVKVVLLEELEANPEKVLKEVLSFLEVDPKVIIDTETKYSHSGKPKNKFVAKLTDRNNKVFYALREFIIKITPRNILEKIASKMFAKDTINSTTRKELQAFFKSDIEKLESLLNKNLKDWR